MPKRKKLTAEDVLALAKALTPAERERFDEAYLYHSARYRWQRYDLCIALAKLQLENGRGGRPQNEANEKLDQRLLGLRQPGPFAKTRMSWQALTMQLREEGFRTKRGKEYDVNAVKALWKRAYKRASTVHLHEHASKLWPSRLSSHDVIPAR